MQLIRPGDEGAAVRDVQHRLTELGLRIDPAELEGRFGASTERAVREFQDARRLPVDGVVGPDTWTQLVEAGYRLGDRTLYLRSPAFRGDDVRELQRMLNALGFDAGKQDGIFGLRTAEAVMEFQRNLGDEVDGIVGLDTVRSLERMRPSGGGPGMAVVREQEAVRSMGLTLAGATIALDAVDEITAPTIVDAGSPAVALAADLSRVLEERGARPVVLHGPSSEPAERARAANALEAVVCVGIRLAAEVAPGSVSCAYWGTATTHSPAGRRLAELIHAELTALGLADGGIRPLGVSLLRETRMPAVIVEPGSAAEPKDRARLADAAARREVAQAVADAIERFLTGTP